MIEHPSTTLINLKCQIVNGISSQAVSNNVSFSLNMRVKQMIKERDKSFVSLISKVVNSKLKINISNESK